jgi:ATP-binding cassette subfamily B multidrug efflux pump
MEKNLFLNLKAVLWQHRWRFLKGLLMLIVANGLLIVNPLIFRQAVLALDSQVDPAEGTFLHFINRYFGSYTHSLLLWVGILLLVALVAGFFKYRMRIELIAVSRDVERDVRSKLFARIQSQSRSFYDRHGIGELLSRLTNDIAAYRDILGPGILYPLFFATLVIPGLMALFMISKTLATVALIPLFLIPIVNMVMRKKIYEVSHYVQTYLGILSNMTQEHFSGIRIIKSYVIESAVAKLFRELCRKLATYNLRLSILQGMLFPFFTLLTKMVTILLVLVSGFVILRGTGTFSVADFVSFMWIQSYIFLPLLMLAWVLPIYERGRAAYDRLVEIYEEPIEFSQEPSLNIHIPPKADIVLKDLTFSYPGTTRPIFSRLNLHLKGGSFVGITGPVGVGKTTLLRLLNREYEIPRGMIFIGEHDIHDYNREAFSHEIVTVEQIPFLFSKTIAENVRFGRELATQEEIEGIAQLADLHETVLEFPEQYDTLVGERGVTLSGGQKQRVAMARAFLVNRSILLLDDVFSAIDASTEKRIFTAMKKNFEGKTLLMITHRVSILEQMDRIIYMQQGQILEDGSPQELVKQKGYYQKLTELQRMS